jgi:hypothetical protein
MVMIRSLTQAWSRALGVMTARGREGGAPPRRAGTGSFSLTGVGRFSVAATFSMPFFDADGGNDKARIN